MAVRQTLQLLKLPANYCGVRRIVFRSVQPARKSHDAAARTPPALVHVAGRVISLHELVSLRMCTIELRPKYSAPAVLQRTAARTQVPRCSFLLSCKHGKVTYQ